MKIYSSDLRLDSHVSSQWKMAVYYIAGKFGRKQVWRIASDLPN